MIIIRKNTLPDYHLLSQKLSGAADDGYQHREKWQHAPILGVNIKETVADQVQQVDENVFSIIGKSTLKRSRFNIQKEFDGDQVILLNTLSEAMVLLSVEEAAYLKGLDKIFAFDQSLIMYQLFRLGFLVRTDENEDFKLRIIRERSAFSSDDAVNITIYPTQECNARCRYCFEYGEKKSPMSDETVEKVIEYILRNVSVDDEVVFRWFGGEPLMGENRIDQIIEAVDTHFEHKLKFNSIITTNGYYISDALIQKARDKWHTKKFHLTIDGWRDEHNKRKNYIGSDVDAYQKTLTDIKKLLDAGVFVVCRLNLDKNNIGTIDNILEDLLPFRDEKNFYIHATTLRRPPKARLEDYINPSDFSWAYDIILRKLLSYGFYKDIKNILPLRSRGNCLACVLNGIIINSDGNLFKCLQHTTDESQRVGTCESGVIFNDDLIGWMDLSTDRTECRSCPFMPLCMGGCKHYISENRSEISPCAREKHYINVILQIVYEWITNNCHLNEESHV